MYWTKINDLSLQNYSYKENINRHVKIKGSKILKKKMANKLIVECYCFLLITFLEWRKRRMSSLQPDMSLFQKYLLDRSQET